MIFILASLFWNTLYTHSKHQWRRTGTTRFSAEGGRLPKRRRQSPAFNLAITHQMAPPRHRRIIAFLVIYLPRKDERLSWPNWLTCSGRFTHIVVTRRLQAEHRTGSVRRPKTGVLPTVLRNHGYHVQSPGMCGTLSDSSVLLLYLCAPPRLNILCSDKQTQPSHRTEGQTLFHLQHV